MTDDNEPITEEWMMSIGFEKVESDMGPNYADHLQRGRLNVWEFNGSGRWLFNDADWIEMTTRRQIRLLLELTNSCLSESQQP